MQSPSSWHLVRQLLASAQVKPLQLPEVALAQLPMPSHKAAGVTVPLSQRAVSHVVSLPARPAQLVRVAPSHAADLHGLVVSTVHAMRAPCGGPPTAEQVPSLPFA